MSPELRKSTEVILKNEIDMWTVASGVLHGVSVSQIRQLPDEPTGRAGLFAARVVCRARARWHAGGVATEFPWVHLGIGDGGDLEVVAAFVAEQILVQLAVPLPAQTLERRGAIVTRRQARYRIGNEAPALK